MVTVRTAEARAARAVWVMSPQIEERIRKIGECIKQEYGAEKVILFYEEKQGSSKRSG